MYFSETDYYKRSHLVKPCYFSYCHVFQNLANRIPRFAVFKDLFLIDISGIRYVKQTVLSRFIRTKLEHIAFRYFVL